MPGAFRAAKGKEKEKKDKKKPDEVGPTILTGAYVFANGDKYDGEYIQSDDGIIRYGKGKQTTTDGCVYDGEWSDDKMNGKGTLSHPSGSVYDGEFVRNQFHGQGKYMWPNGSFYEGDFVENRLEGKGFFTDTEGQVWTGQFRYKAAPGLQFQIRLD